MDASERQRLDIVLRHHSLEQMQQMESQISQAQIAFSVGGRTGSGAHFKAIVDAMGTAAYGFAEKSVVEVTIISQSAECFEIWKQSVLTITNQAFEVWYARLSPIDGGISSLNFEKLYAVETGISKWREQILNLIDKFSRYFTDLNWTYPTEYSNLVVDLPAATKRNRSSVIGSQSAVCRVKQRPLSEAKLRAWWENLGINGEAVSQILLLDDVRKAHPGYFVSRDRIRKLAAGRKRGRPSIGGKMTAD